MLAVTAGRLLELLLTSTVGPREPEAAADHGVVRWGCRKPVELGAAVLDSAGKRSACTRDALATLELLDEAEPTIAVVTVPDDVATLAIRSRTCREDCCCDRAAVEFFAFSTLPDVMPA